jgi:hypothetical protein
LRGFATKLCKISRRYARVCGVQIAPGAVATAPLRPQAAAITSRQFSLRQIFGLTTVVAAMMTFVRLLGQLESGGDLFVTILIFLSPAAITWARSRCCSAPRCCPAAWRAASLRPHRRAAGATPPPQSGAPAGLMLNLGILLILSLGALRLSGYRLAARALTLDPPPTPDL